MKFVFQWTRRSGAPHSEEDLVAERRVFDAWLPDRRLTLLHFLSRSDGRGGMAVVEVDEVDARLLGRTAAIFRPWYEFDIIPVMDIPDAIALDDEARAFRERLSGADGPPARPDGPPDRPADV